MNNFVFGQDPLLYTTTIPQQPTEVDIKRQLDTVMAQYQALQQQKPPVPQERIVEDHIGGLDNMMQSLNQNLLDVLNNNAEFIQLNQSLQQSIQIELMRGIKEKLNTNHEVVAKVSRMKEIIQEVKIQQDNEDRQSLSELNDYIKNYSDMTFNEYKQLKQTRNESTRI
jgi:hypothetical protein